MSEPVSEEWREGWAQAVDWLEAQGYIGRIEAVMAYEESGHHPSSSTTD